MPKNRQTHAYFDEGDREMLAIESEHSGVSISKLIQLIVMPELHRRARQRQEKRDRDAAMEDRIAP